MADTKITDLAAITGANTAAGDQFVVVDVSDTTMASSGTDKKITKAELLTIFEAAGAAAAAQAASQPLDSDLTAIAALSTTAYGRAFLTLANQAATMALLSAASDTASGIVELATNAETATGTDTGRAVTPANVASVLASYLTTSAAAAGYQPLDSDLTAIAALTTTAYGRAFLALANQAALMALLSAASDTASGIVELATTAETTTGTDTGRAVTPAGLLNATTASNINARVAVKKAGSLIATRRGINFIEGSGVTITTADDAGNEEVDVTIAASGGGGIGAGQSFQVAASYVPTSIFADVASFTNNILNGNEVHFIPLILDANATADRIGISVHTAAAGGEVARLAIYNTANGRPTTVLLDAGTVAVDSTGVKEITISQALSAGVLYALAVHFKVNTQVHCFGGQSSVESVFGYQAVSTRASGAYGSGLPASPTITTNSGKNAPIIRVRLT